MKNIVVIGNGSDRALELPTRYLDFMSIVNAYDSAIRDSRMTNLSDFLGEFRDTYVEKYARDYLNRRLGLSNGEEDPEIEKLEPLFTAKRNNFWLLLYGALVDEEREALSRGESIGSWTDFEWEMEQVLLTIYEAMEKGEITFGYKRVCSEQTKGTLNQILSFFNQAHSKIKDINQMIQWLERDLYQFKHCLNLYLEAFVNAPMRDGFVHEQVPQLVQIKIDKLISFNYTSTYQLLYDSNVEVDYVHGIADITHTIETSNIVLGIENELLDSDDAKRVLFSGFQKSWQRLMYGTEKMYKDWINSEYNLFIYGHSLGVRDRSILRELILNEHNKSTTIYCLNRYAEDQCKKNLILILGGEVLRQKLSNKMLQFVNLQGM